jgi:hypothetical protein
MNEHVPTAQEEAIYKALGEGDTAAVEQMRADAYAADQTPPDPLPPDWYPPAQQFEIDYAYALDHYHDDNEMPEAEREDNTATAARDHNADAEGRTFALFGLTPDDVTQGVGQQVELHLQGQGFTTTARIVFDEIELATAYVSDSELYCTIDASIGGHAPGTFDVLVRQDGQETEALSFTIAPAPEAEPASANGGGEPPSAA